MNTRRTITFSDEDVKYIEEKVKSGEHLSRADFIRYAVRSLREDDRKKNSSTSGGLVLGIYEDTKDPELIRELADAMDMEIMDFTKNENKS